MRYEGLLACGIVLAGLTITATLATGTTEDSDLYGSSASGALVILTKAKIDGVGKVWARCTSDDASLGVGSMVTATSDAVLSFGGWMSQDIKGGDGVVTSTQSLLASIPIPDLGDRRGKLRNAPEYLLESPFRYDLERFVNGSLVTSTVEIDPWEPWEPPDDPPIIVLAKKHRPSRVLLDGALSVSTLSTSGFVKTNRRGVKLSARITVRFEGWVVTGPHEGSPVKGVMKIRYRGAVED